ncbi:MAG TPA: glycine zipper domain-containing protein [Pyrinomonadaceae bacterium]|jgi:predicted MFS family arabinose efflux permease
MKKFIATFVMMAMMAIMIPLGATSVNAQRRSYKKPNVYQKHRNLINIGIGTAAGAIIGGLIGGKKGALLGTAVGAGGSALYTYKLNPKTKRYYRVRRY